MSSILGLIPIPASLTLWPLTVLIMAKSRNMKQHMAYSMHRYQGQITYYMFISQAFLPSFLTHKLESVTLIKEGETGLQAFP